MQDFFTDLMLRVDAALLNYVFNLFSLLTQQYENTVRLLIVLAVIVLGLLAIRGYHDMWQRIWKMIISVAFVMLATNWDYYGWIVFDFFNQYPLDVAESLTPGKQPLEEMGILVHNLYFISTRLVAEGSLGGAWSMAVSGFFYWIASTIMAMSAMFLILCARVLIGVLLGLGPLIVPLVLFDGTRGIFNVWLGTLIGMAITQILALSLIVFIIALLLPDVKAVAIDIASGIATLHTTDISGNIIMMGIATALFAVILPISYAMGNGARLHFASGFHAMDRGIHRASRGLRSATKGTARMLKKISGISTTNVIKRAP